MLCSRYDYSALENSSETFVTGSQLKLMQTSNASRFNRLSANKIGQYK